MKKMLIYNDEGVNGFSLQETLHACKREFSSLFIIETADHKMLTCSHWEEETDLLIFPGGRDVPYHCLLKGQAAKKISTFVQNGGKYLGICAGAYFGASKVLFEVGTEREVNEERELKFFQGAAIGTLYRHRLFVYNSHQGAHGAFISFAKEIIPLYYNGGCYFENAEKFSPNVTILGRYKEEENRAAIILCKVGKGAALLSGVHIEIDCKTLENANDLPKEVTNTLRPYEDSRKKLFRSLMLKLL